MDNRKITVTNTANRTRCDVLTDLACPHSDLDDAIVLKVREILAAAGPESLIWIAILLTRALLQDADEEDPQIYDVIRYLVDPSGSCSEIQVSRDDLRAAIEKLHPDDWRTIENVWRHVRESFVPSSALAEPLKVDQGTRDAAYLCHLALVDPWDASLDAEVERLRSRFPWLVALEHHMELERGLYDLASQEGASEDATDPTRSINIGEYLLAGASFRMAAAAAQPDHLAAVDFIDITEATRESGLDSLRFAVIQLVDANVLVILGGCEDLVSPTEGEVELHCVDPPRASFALRELTDPKLQSNVPRRFSNGMVLHNPDLSVTALLNRSAYLTFRDRQILVPVGRLSQTGDEACSRVRELIEELHRTGAADRFVQELPENVDRSEDAWLANDYLWRLTTSHRGFILAPRKFARSVASRAWIDAEVRDAARAMAEASK